MSAVQELWFAEYNRKKNVIKDFKTIKFTENWNNKLYGKYFTTIRQADFDVDVGTLVDVELKGKGIKLARVIGCDVVRFGDLSEVTIMIDTGLKYSDALVLFKRFGLNVNDFELKVKYILLESV